MLVLLLVAIFLVLFFAVREVRRSGRGRVPARSTGSQEVIYRTPLDSVSVLKVNPQPRIREIGTQEHWTPVNGPMVLIVREGGFEVSSPVGFFRWLLSLEYHFIGRETSIAISELPSHHYSKQWITVSGGGVRLAIASNSNLRTIWNVLMETGVTVSGAIPPGMSR